MGFTPLFELFAGPLSLHLNPVSVLGGVIPANLNDFLFKRNMKKNFLDILLTPD